MVDDGSVIVGTLESGILEKIVVVSKRVELSTSNIKHGVSIGIHHIITLALGEINEIDDLRIVLINIRIVLGKFVNWEAWVDHIDARGLVDWPVLLGLPQNQRSFQHEILVLNFSLEDLQDGCHFIDCSK